MTEGEHTDCLEDIQERIGYRFRDQALLRRAFTHASYANEQGKEKYPNNERLEFLGDSVLGMIIAELLFTRMEEREGELARAKNNLVNSHTLSKRSRELGLGNCLLLGRGEELSGGRERRSNLENAFEAFLGALYLDGGLEVARAFISQSFATAIANYSPTRTSRIEYKGTLQERVQALKGETPHYRIIQEEGPAHQKTFTAEVVYGGETVAIGSGASKKAAEQEAARLALEQLDVESPDSL